MPRGILTVCVIGSALWVMSQRPAHAAEFGMGPWVKGYTDIFGGVIPSQPGFYFRGDAYHYNGSADTTISDGRVALGVDQDYTATLMALTYVTPWRPSVGPSPRGFPASLPWT